MDSTISRSHQDYLKTIYDLTRDGEVTSTNAIAARLGVKAASVTNMLKKMAAMQPALVEYIKHRGVKLSPQGEQEALKILRRHRLIELFLVEILGYAWFEVHEEAEHLEHAISKKFEERLAVLLGEPDFDPHGDPIPGRDLILPETRWTRLSDLQPERLAVIRQVHSSDPQMLHYLDQMGIIPEEKICVKEIAGVDRVIHLEVGDQARPCVVGEEVGNIVKVEAHSHPSI